MKILKKIIKYALILGIIGVIAFFSLKLIFPTPTLTDAFETTQSLISNQEMLDFLDTSQNFENFYKLHAEPTQQTQNNSDYITSIRFNLLTQISMLDYLLDNVIFASN